MIRSRTFVTRMAAGFGVMVVLVVVTGIVSIAALGNVVSSKDHVINVNSRLVIDAGNLNTSLALKSAAARGYLLSQDTAYLTQMTAARQSFESQLATTERAVPTGAEHSVLLSIGRVEDSHQKAIDAAIAERRAGASTAVVSQTFLTKIDPLFNAVESDLKLFVTREDALLAETRQSSTNAAHHAESLILFIAIMAVILAGSLAFLLTRVLRRQIGTAVGEVKTSSTELQATASQQASGAKEQATAMSEITTTISELLASASQIAESAQRVTQVAEQTAEAGRSGEHTIAKARDSMDDIRAQVDIIVDHMLELGQKSQEIGSVLDIVTELAEQTNILAINSTIEAAGAGEGGRRFAAVADEIRKLADRVSDSTKEIRSLIDVVRGAVNTTVMAMEIGSKAVDAGNDQFRDVTSAFGDIASLASTTTDAAREIELSTKQQTTAVEQVNLAVANVAQSTREAETSSGQTLQTASQLTKLSQNLVQLVQAQAG